ncbi:protein-histidine kinase [Gigaspora margarita]|uniref:histidine kinase n=1 Tax=Gigaspora margarita TaxID=4874 RepID=A0A8H4B0A5_GIGMA|nr:protein-histidine kinase [Gigaspora margarita]
MSLPLNCTDNTENEEVNMKNMVNNYDWSSTILGPMDLWEPTIKTAMCLCLNSTFPILLYIGPPEWIFLYNDAFSEYLKQDHPYALGKPMRDIWPKTLCDIVFPQLEYVRTTKKGLFKKDEYYEAPRAGYAEESYFDYAYSPIFKLDGTVWGVLDIAQETTQSVLNTRRLKILNEFGKRVSEIESLESVCHIMTDVLSSSKDVSYALIYFVEHKLNVGLESLIARLISTTFDKDGKVGRNIPDYLTETPEIINLAEDAKKSYDTYVELKRDAVTGSFLKCESWPIHLVIKKERHVKVLLKDESRAILLPTKIPLYEGKSLSAVLICGVNRLCNLDEKYTDFLQLVMSQMNTYLVHGQSIEEEKKRSKILTDLNYQKVIFFQGISHELKTPLTLMLSPLDDVINACSHETPIMSYLQTIRHVMMPNMNGHELLDVLRSDVRTQAIPVILLSAQAEDSKIQGLNKGADDYILKPFSSRDLITRIRTNIKLSHFRRKILYQHYKQEQTKQLLLSISNKILSKSNLYETLQYVVKEIYHILPCERIFIISREQSEYNNNKMVALYECSESITPIITPFMEFSNNENDSQTFELQDLINNTGTDICLDTYCDYVDKNVSEVSVELRLKDDYWGWIKAHRSPSSIWLDSEIELFQQVSNQISLTIAYSNLSEENVEREIQLKAAEAASYIKSQILANTSHELRTPLGAITGILSSFEGATLTTKQIDMINIMTHASDNVLSIVNNILDAAKLEARKITLVDRTFDLLELFETTIEEFGKKAADKDIELIFNYDVDLLPRYVKSDPGRLKQVLYHLLSNAVKFTDKGEIMMNVSMQSQKVDENPIYSQIVKRGNLLIELYDTGIGMDPKYEQHAWKSFSQGDMSITKKQDGTGLGLSICKNLVEINGGEINVESQSGQGSKFWFTWNFEFLSMTSSLLEPKFDEQISYAIKLKRILIIHPIENVRNTMIKYLKSVEKIDAFDTFDKGIREAKNYEELHSKFAYNIVFIGLYENHEEEALKAVFELKGLEMNSNNLTIIFIVLPNKKGNELAKKFIAKVGGTIYTLYAPITLKKLNSVLH